MVTKLTIANGAMRLLEERKLTQSELTSGLREAAAIFNDVWDDGGRDACLQAGQWRFAKRSMMIDSSPSVTPAFGYEYAFDKPSDFVRGMGVWSDEMMSQPLGSYREESGYWFATIDPIYVAYVSNDASFGLDYSLWPQDFIEFVEAHFASRIAGPMTSKSKDLETLRSIRLKTALNTNGQADPVKHAQAGSWVRARGGSRSWPDGNPRP